MDFFGKFGDWLRQLIEGLSGWKPDPQHRDQLQVVAASFAILTGAFATNRARITAQRYFGGGKTLSPDERVLADHIADKNKLQLEQAITELKQTLAAKEAASYTPGHHPAPTSTSTHGLSRDLDAAIATLLAAGRADALADKSGAAAEAAIDGLITERAKARERVAKDEAGLWRQKGALAFLHDTQRALAAYTRATELDPDDAEGWNWLGLLRRRLGDLESAAAAYAEVLRLAEVRNDRRTIAIASGNLGNLLITRGDLDGAEAMYRKSLEIEVALDQRKGMATDYGNLGVLLLQRGDLDGAEAMHLKSLAINEALGNKQGIADQFGNLGILMRARGKLDGAETMYRKSLAIDQAIGRHEGMASTYGNLGILLSVQGKLEVAEDMYRAALALNARLGRKEGMALQHGNLGNLFAQIGDLNKACDHWNKSRDLFRAIGAKPMEAKLEALLRDASCSSVASPTHTAACPVPWGGVVTLRVVKTPDMHALGRVAFRGSGRREWGQLAH
jgi:tetratricopeptide (TPR) repeat protein